MTTLLSVRVLSQDAILAHLAPLCDILENSVNGGASVSFMLPFSRDKAVAFWQKVARSVAAVRGLRAYLCANLRRLR